MRLCLSIVLSTSVAACCAVRPAPEDARRPAATARGPERDALTLRIDQTVDRLVPAGFTRVAGLAGRGFLTEGTSASHSLEIEAGLCLTVLSVGSVGVRDVDAQIYSPDGTVLAEDDEPDPHPVVQLCAERRMRVYYVVKMFAGAGAYRFVALRSDREALPAAIRLLRGGAEARAQRSSLDLRLEELGARLADRGFAARGDPVTSTLGGHETVRFALPTEKSVCYTVVALGGDGVRNIDLVLLDEAALQVARDVGPAVDAMTQFCSENEETISAEVRMVSGSGEVRFAVFGGASEAIGGAGRLWLGERRDRPSELPIEAAVAAAQEELRRAGYTLRPAQAPTKIQQREVQSHSVQTPAGRCTAVVAVGGRGLGRLRVGAFDAAGDPLVDPTVGIGAAGARICPARAGTARVDVEAVRGGGEVSLVVGDVATQPSLRSARPLIASRLQTLIDQATADGYVRSADVVAGRMPSGGLRQHPVPSAARCQRVVAAVDGMGTEARLFFLDAATRRVAADHATGGAAWIELCDAPGVVSSVELRVERGGDEVEYRLATMEKR
ncbi:MAG: hypothetical protein HYY06_21370 [Deltaproteobacteria bacterium]|nr:hypothetical protein [Deltaproteobacteria bacterium]